MKRSEQMTCDSCIWYEQCGGDLCEDYSPGDGGDAITYYEDILEENEEEYRMVVLQYADCDGYGGDDI